MFRPNYSMEELQVLVENYQELSRYSRDKEYVQVRLMDVEVALRKLEPAERAVVLLCGFLDYSTHAAGRILGVPQKTVWRRYQKGLTNLLERINGN